MSVETDVDSADPIDVVAPEAVRYSRITLALGLLGRAWIWFIAGCLALSLAPMLFGWHSFMVKSGSMRPHISVGDVVLASPIPSHMDLRGHVIEFDAPDKPGEILIHRAIGRDKAGLLITKGDANQTPDSVHVERAHVHGLGRILVRYVGLPVIWTETGQWLKLMAFLLTLVLSVIAIARDGDPEPEPRPTDPGDPEDPTAAFVPEQAGAPSHENTQGDEALPAQASAPRAPRRRLRRPPMWVLRALFVFIGTVSMVIPTAFAAFSATTANAANTWSVPKYNYTTETQNLVPYLYWKLDETGTTTTTALDSSPNGTHTGTYAPDGKAASFTRGMAGALVDQAVNTAVQPIAANACIYSTGPTTPTTGLVGPTTLTEIIWFKATVGDTSGGKLIGFESPRTGQGVAGSGGTYDRHIYMDGAGKIWFGVYNGGDQLISSPLAYNDGKWHMAAATLGAAGMHLYIDGVQVGTNTNTTAEASSGWFRVGCGNLSGWADGWTGVSTPPASTTASDYVFNGGLDEATVFMSQLTAANIAFLYWIR